MKNRGIAIVLALFLGGLGIHRFYDGRITSGFFMLLFFWTFIPFLIALYDVACYAMLGDDGFNRKYNGA